jgi:putative ABC transport system substrate-binding protein
VAAAGPRTDSMMDRRTFIGALIGVLGAASSATRAERTARPYRIGFLANNPGPQPAHGGLREGLRDLGWIEGRDFLIEARYANFDTSRLRTFAAELVALPVDVLVVVTIAPAQVANEATKDIPIVVVAAHDAVGTGLVASLSRPGGNLTGLDSLAPGLDAKRLELLKQILPGVTHIAVLANPLDSAMRLHLDAIQTAGAALGLTIRVFEVRQPTELEGAFAAMARERPDALLPITEALIYSSRERIVAFTQQQRLPGVFEFSEFARAGGLLSYGPNLRAMYVRAAHYVDKILKGAKPGDLPIEQPTRFELVINLKTAKTLGLTIPQLLVQRADEVIK